MNYKEARKKYFEECVEFEWQIRKLARITKRPHKGSLRKQIEVLDIPPSLREKEPYINFYNEIKQHQFRKAYLRQFKNARNCLAHTRGTKIVKNKHTTFLSNLKQDIFDLTSLNTKLTIILNTHEIKQEDLKNEVSKEKEA